jgi:hypothetical protein
MSGFGGGGSGNAVARVAQWFGWTEDVAKEKISRYKENPESEEFNNFTPEERENMERFTGMAQPPQQMPRQQGDRPRARQWHWKTDGRPDERDLKKAEIFLQEILEDYYEGIE